MSRAPPSHPVRSLSALCFWFKHFVFNRFLWYFLPSTSRKDFLQPRSPGVLPRCVERAICCRAAAADLKGKQISAQGRSEGPTGSPGAGLFFLIFDLLPEHEHASCSPTVLLPGKSVSLLSAIVHFRFSTYLSPLILMLYSPFGRLQICQGKALTWTCSQHHKNKSLALGTENLQSRAQKQSEAADAQGLPRPGKQRRCFGSHHFSSSPLVNPSPAVMPSAGQSPASGTCCLLAKPPAKDTPFIARKTRKDRCPPA